MALPKLRASCAGRRFALRVVIACLSGLFAAGAPAMAEAACVAAAVNGAGKQIRGTRSITHGIFPRFVCRRALRHCERRLDEIRYDSGRRRPHARCEIIASGPRAAEIFGPALEGWRLDRKRNDPAYRHDEYAGDRRYDPPQRDPLHDPLHAPEPGGPGAHDGWRSAERPPGKDGRYDDLYEDRRYNDQRYNDRRYDDGRHSDERYGDGRYEDPRYEDRRFDAPPQDDRAYRGGDPLIDDLLRDEGARNPPPDRRYAPYESDRSAGGCNVTACASRYKTFRSSDCSYKPTLYERRRCPL